MHHDSVRTLNGGSRQRTAVREHNDAEALCGASWYKVQQRWQAYVTHDGRKFHLGWYQHEEHAAKVRDLMAIKLRGMHTPLNFVPETYSDIYELLAQVDQVAGWWVMLCCMWRVSNTPMHCEKLLAESAWQQQRMTCEAAIEASDPTMGTDCEDATPTATTLPCQPSHPLTPHSAAGGGMAMGDDVATRFDAALDELLLHASVRAPSTLQRQKHNDAGDFCGAVWSKANQHWRAQVSHNGRNLYLGCFQHEEHAAKVHDLMAIKLRGMHTALNFVPETYSDMYELLAQVDQALLLELLQANSRTRNKLLAESARQQQRMALEAALEASDPTMGTDIEDATPTATTLPCQPSPPLASHSTAGCGMPIMGDDVATRFGSALEAVLSHASVRVPSNLNRLTPGRQHNGAGDFCGTGWDETSRRWKAGVSHHGRRFYLGCYQHEEHAAKALLVELLLSFSRTRNKLLAESARQQKRITPKAALEASDLTMSTDGEDSSNKVAAMFDPVLEALLHHNSVRSLNRLQPGLRQHKEAGGLCGVFWNKAQQRPWTVGDVEATAPPLALHMTSLLPCGCQRQPTMPPLAPHMASLHPCSCQCQPGEPACHASLLSPCRLNYHIMVAKFTLVASSMKSMLPRSMT
ncbi:AP2/ERF domain-containing protein, partial [Haematococcus lacustris]